jgi:hypothetical protein
MGKRNIITRIVLIILPPYLNDSTVTTVVAGAIKLTPVAPDTDLNTGLASFTKRLELPVAVVADGTVAVPPILI